MLLLLVKCFQVFLEQMNSSALFIDCRTSNGRGFQMAGPDTEKPHRPNRVVSALGAMRSTLTHQSKASTAGVWGKWEHRVSGGKPWRCRPGSSEQKGRH